MDINKNDIFRRPNNSCKCCGGSGVQKNMKTGLIQECPCCFGTGKGKTIHKPFYRTNLR
jgi:hypothetical protein